MGAPIALPAACNSALDMAQLKLEMLTERGEEGERVSSPLTMNRRQLKYLRSPEDRPNGAGVLVRLTDCLSGHPQDSTGMECGHQIGGLTFIILIPVLKCAKRRGMGVQQRAGGQNSGKKVRATVRDIACVILSSYFVARAVVSELSEDRLQRAGEIGHLALIKY
ncbi:hypothetical protein BDV93DRAFT_203653 [Ceratobasidium sp. AG-I]|nr:hypothetical protein BDV93DRAFT_203653 [Ceratobasidium sp. AG-I]